MTSFELEKFTEKKFNIGPIEGLSSKTIEGHLKLYAGYVKHANLIIEKISELSTDTTTNAYLIGELQRRFSFEFNGIRNHEYYFEQIEGGSTDLNPESDLAKKITEAFGSVDNWFNQFKTLCLTRGIGWAILYFDKNTNRLLHSWIDEQHLGQLIGLDVIYAVDVWEHAYLLDYIPSDKKNYIDAFIKATNFSVVQSRFKSL